MNRIVYLLFTAAALASCAKSYNIQGISNIATLDGHMLYLKVYDNNDLKTIDSCDVVHGKFQFHGSMDSTKIATLFMDDNGIMPVVIESGDIVVKIDETQQHVSGTPLNEKLFDFISEYAKLENQANDLGRKQSQAIMNGEDESEINARLSIEADKLLQEEDRLVTSFIIENFDNVLGPGVFFMMTAGNQIPQLQPWIEDIMSKATDKFKNDSYVKDYYEKAIQNEAIMNGTATPDAPMPQTVEQPVPQMPVPPTPNEMAQPAESEIQMTNDK